MKMRSKMRCGMNFGVQKEKKIRSSEVKKKAKIWLKKGTVFTVSFVWFLGLKKRKNTVFEVEKKQKIQRKSDKINMKK